MQQAGFKVLDLAVARQQIEEAFALLRVDVEARGAAAEQVLGHIAGGLGKEPADLPDSAVPVRQDEARGAGIHKRPRERLTFGKLRGNALALAHFPVQAPVPHQHGTEQQQDRDHARDRPAHHGFQVEAALVERLLEEPVLHERYMVVPPPTRIERRVDAIARLEEPFEFPGQIRGIARNTPADVDRLANRESDGEALGVLSRPA
ncbi:hypothetical protein D3C76_669890 [compost metagenome]